MAEIIRRVRARAAALPTFDVPFLIILLLLLSYGLLMLFSAGYAVALYRRGDAYTYIRPQLLFAALGTAAMYAASLVDYHIWHKLAWPVLGLSLILLVIVLFMPEYNGCKRWLVLPGLGTLQPSEIAKFAVVLVFSHMISLNHDRMKSFTTGVLPFAVILGVVAVLMLLEPHLSGTLLILSIGAVLMFVGGTGLKWFALAGGLGAAAIAAAVAALPELPGWLNALKAANVRFKAAMQKQVEERMRRSSKKKAKVTRASLQKSYEALVTLFNAWAMVLGDADYVDLFAWWNALIDRYRVLISARLGAGVGGKTDSGASTRSE